MKKTYIIIFAIFFIFNNTLACTCVQNKSVIDAYYSANYVFIGKVENINNIGIFNGNIFGEGENSVKFGIKSVIKGDELSEISIKTSGQQSSCGINFINGQYYLVYANGTKTDLEVSLCSRTKLLSEAKEDLNIFKKNNINIEKKSFNEQNNLTFYVNIFLLFILFSLLLVFYKTKKR